MRGLFLFVFLGCSVASQAQLLPVQDGIAGTINDRFGSSVTTNRGQPPFTTSCIYTSSAYSSFPRMIVLSNGLFLATIRHATDHYSNGVCKVLSGSHPTNLSVIASLTAPAPMTDLRQGLLCETPDGRVQMLNTMWKGNGVQTNIICYSSDSGTNWSGWMTNSTLAGQIAFDTHWVGGTNWVAAYTQSALTTSTLYRSTDGTNFALHATVDGPVANEVALNFSGSTCTGVTRRASSVRGALVWANPPYTNFTALAQGMFQEGQSLLRASDGRLFVVGRCIQSDLANEGRCAAIWKVDGSNIVPAQVWFPPYGPDGGYGQAVEFGGRLWMIYDATGQTNKSDIFVGSVLLSDLP